MDEQPIFTEPQQPAPATMDAGGGPAAPVPPVAEAAAPRPKRGCGVVLASLVVGLVAGLAGGYAATRLAPPASSSAPRSVVVAGSTTDEPVAAAAAAAVASVVNIDVSGEPTETTAQHGLPQGHPDVPFSGQGSGVAWREADGNATYILTNEHVVTDATDIKVTAADGGRFKATLVGADAETDIAVIRVPGKVSLIDIADSDDLVVGQLVVAIGSPYGLEHSVSSGVISGLHRSLPTDYGDSGTTGVYPLVDVIQTDAAINPGNSGGALVDRKGRLVGINTAIYSDTGASAGVGFAIPAKSVVRIAEELVSSGKAKHPFLGILGQSVNEALAKEKDLPASDGALVVEVTAGTNAAKAGLKVDDLVVALDGKPIRSMDDLILAVRRTRVGQTVTLTLWRDGKRIEVKMEVGDKPTG